MTDNEQTKSLLHQAAGAIPVDPPPLADLLRQGQRAKRRRTLGVVAMAAVGVLLVGGGTTWAVGGLNVSSAPSTPAATGGTSTPPTGLPTPPGTRLVGFNGVGVAVPVGWSTNAAGCGVAEGNTVVVGPMPASDCVLIQPDVSWVSLEPFTIATCASCWKPNGTLGGIPTVRTPVQVRPCNFGSCHMYSAALLVDSRAMVSVSSPDRATVGRILSSAFAIPPAYVAVPPQPSEKTLQAQGLNVQVRHLYRPGIDEGTLIATTPAVGTVVAKGSAVGLVLTTQQTAGACGDLAVTVTTPSGEQQVRPSTPNFNVRVRMHVGDVVRITASGRCAGHVTNSQPSSILRERGAGGFEAVGVGRTHVDVGLPMCYEPGCRGGTYFFATVKVTVQPAQ